MASHHLLLSLASFVFSGELVFLCGGCFVFLFSLSWCSFCFVGFCLLLWWFVGVGGPSPTVAGPPPLLLLRFGVMMLAGTATVVVSWWCMVAPPHHRHYPPSVSDWFDLLLF
jgi:hypothetical protein